MWHPVTGGYPVLATGPDHVRGRENYTVSGQARGRGHGVYAGNFKQFIFQRLVLPGDIR